MLSLANTISSSGSAHEQMYSLFLDGDSDYLDIGDNLDFGTNDFAISLWFKQDAAATSSELLFSKHQDTNNKINIVLNSSNKIQANITADSNDVFTSAGGAALEGDGGYWIHVVLTCDRDGDTKLYINGTTSTYGVSASSVNSSQNLNNSASIFIGARSNSSLYFPGKIDEVAIWQAADLSDFDSDAVQAIRNGGDPFDLNYDRGDYHHSASLTGYWRMFNGPFDDLQNGVVHDAHNPGYGSELVTSWTNVDFDTFTSSGSNITQMDSGASGDNCYASATITRGKTYKLQFTCSDNITGQVRISPNTNLTSAQTALSNPRAGLNTAYFAADTNYSYIGFYAASTFSDVQISSFTLKELNGYPGLTSGTATFSANTPDD